MEQQRMVKYGAVWCVIISGGLIYLGIVMSWAFLPVAGIDVITAVGLWKFKEWARKFAAPALGMQAVTMIFVSLQIVSKANADLFVFTTGTLIWITFSMYRRLRRPEVRKLFS